MVYTLEILADNSEIRDFYTKRANHASDSGVDLYFPEDHKITCFACLKINMGIKCRMVDEKGNTVPYYLYPRSSISNTPLILANSVGIVDKAYRGSIIAALRYVPDLNYKMELPDSLVKINLPVYEVKRGERLLQICGPDLSPLAVRLVDSLDETERGDGGFGSTGK